MHRPTAIVSPSGEKTTFQYDLLGHKIAVTKGAESKLAATTTHVFDAVGNEIQSTSPTGQVTKHEFDARNRRIRTQDALNRAWTFVYNDNTGSTGPAPCCGADLTANTRAAKTIHPDGSSDAKVTNAAGQLIATTDAKGDTVEYAYDLDGRLIQLTDAKKQVTCWRYDARGKLAAKTYPDKSTELYEHDLAGQMTRRIRPDGTVATYTYNDRSRLLSIVWSDGKTEPSTFAYDAAGHMTLAKNHSATITRSYDESGKLEKEIQEIAMLENPANSNPQLTLLPPVKNVVGYEYSPEGRLARLHYPDATTVAYEYNARGELAHVIDTGLEGKPSSFDYTRRADGKITQINLPNGAKTTKTYDAVGRLETIAHFDKDGKTLESETSRYDLRNRRTSRVHADASTDLFAYDPAGQVTAAAYGAAKESGTGLQPVSTPAGAATNVSSDSPTSNFTPTQTFAYDQAGNRTSVTDNGMITKYHTNEANQYTRIESSESVIVEPSFDKLGNLLQDDRNAYTWDADIHLLSVSTKTTVDNSKPALTTVNFKYDALHRRVARIESHQTTLFIMDAWNVIQEQVVSSPPAVANRLSTIVDGPKLFTRHTWGEDLSGSLQRAGGIGGLLASVHQQQTTANNSKPLQTVLCFMHYDGNGNIILLTSSQCQESARYNYDAFGNTRTATGIAASINHYRFSTKPVETVGGLTYYGYRYYDSVSGRWLSNDPIAELGGLNLYSMVTNDPIGRVDYLGTEIVVIIGCVCVVAGAVGAGYAWCHAEAKDAACMKDRSDFQANCNASEAADAAICAFQGGTYNQGASQSLTCGSHSWSGPCGGGKCDMPDPQPADTNTSSN
ncbi:MAG: hypothetical protein NTV80_08315 [Verrucomicrobia bacterium]|nr:hypothetical protein [Verrucomicrobiota bacterium]